MSSTRLDPSSLADLPEVGEPRSSEHAAEDEAIRHAVWTAWLDVDLPALGHRTPRQAARSARGRERLEALLAAMAEDSLGNPVGPDIAALRQALRLDTPLRRSPRRT